MADSTGADFTSSMTSVTEEEGSLSESDTTETDNSNFSSVINSSDCATDDKLTPSLNNISISKGSGKKVRKLAHAGEHHEDNHSSLCSNRTQGLKHAFARPFAAKAPSYTHSAASNRKYQKSNQCETSVKNHERLKTMEADSSHKVKPQGRNDWNQFTYDYPDYHLYTDFTNNNHNYTSNAFSYADGAEIETDEEEDSENVEDASDSDRFFLPDMNSPSWYTAKVFDHYWLHYNFVMDWFREHVKFVNGQYCQAFRASFPSGCPPPRPHHRRRKNNNTRERKRKRARKRRASRAKHRQKQDCTGEDAAPEGSESIIQEEETIEMEITEDMMKFFSQSFKHRQERDKLKENGGKQEEESTRIDIEQALAGQQGPTTAAPSERPGVRRTAEMKMLYGQGAAMIHGMETALQMTFDKFIDRHQPKLWPNMPLKMSFT